MRNLLFLAALLLCVVPARSAPTEEGIEIILEADSYPGFDRQAVVAGALLTGLASLDSLNIHEGLVRIDAPVVDPKDPLLRPRLVYVFCFSPDTDLNRLAEIYTANEHVATAAPITVFDTAITPQNWGALKNATNAKGSRETND
jgi:hypothetical protein